MADNNAKPKSALQSALAKGSIVHTFVLESCLLSFPSACKISFQSNVWNKRRESSGRLLTFPCFVQRGNRSRRIQWPP
jgi:hypothetical protein